MNNRDLLLGAAVVLLLGVTAWFTLTITPAAAAERATDDPTPPALTAQVTALPTQGTAEAVQTDSTLPLVVDAALRHDAKALQLEAGIIRGDLSLSTAVIEKLDAVTITIVEAINIVSGQPGKRAPFTASKLVTIDRHGRTPTFAIDGVPFSAYGYSVHAIAPGFNGTELHAVITKEHPIADVLLGVTGGTPFSVLVRDQEQSPLTNVLVTMMPVGPPLGRPMVQKPTDNYGSVLFESVLRGNYKIHAGPLYALLCDPKEAEVLADSGNKPQSLTLLVARGNDLPVQVFGPSGIGLADIAIEVYATDTQQFRKYEAKTDFSGQHTFKHLQPGRYQVTVTALAYGRFDRQWQVPDSEAAQPLIVRLVPQ